MKPEIMDAERITVVYAKRVNSEIIDTYEQPLIDVNKEGLIKDKETGEALEIIGCVYNDGTQKVELRSEDLDLVYDLPYGHGNYKRQSFKNINQVGLSNHTRSFAESEKLVILGVAYNDGKLPDLMCPDSKEAFSNSRVRKLTRDEIRTELNGLMKDLEEFIPDSLDEFEKRVEIDDVNSYEREKWDRIQEYRWLLGDSHKNV